MTETVNADNANTSEGNENSSDHNKFKKFEMPILSGTNPDLWLFKADQYFQIHKLTDLEKLTVVVISFNGAALDWYRSQEEHESFVNWANLKNRMLIRF